MALQKLVWVTAAAPPPAHCPLPPATCSCHLQGPFSVLRSYAFILSGATLEKVLRCLRPPTALLWSPTLSCGMRRIHGSNSLRTACEVSRAPEMAGKGGRGQCPPALGRSFMSSRVRRWWEASTGQPVCLPSAFVHPPDF